MFFCQVRGEGKVRKPVLPEGGEEEEEGEEDDEKASARSIRMPERQEEKERLLAALGLFRATLLFTLRKFAFHALAFFGTPALCHLGPLGPQQMPNVLGGDRRSS